MTIQIKAIEQYVHLVFQISVLLLPLVSLVVKALTKCLSFFQPKYYRKIVSYRYLGSKRTPEFSDGCFKCECEPIGSTGEYCAVEGGQCPCHKGQNGAKDVVGRRCNECQDKQGQIVNGRGCVGEYITRINLLHSSWWVVTVSRNVVYAPSGNLGEDLCDTPVFLMSPYVTWACSSTNLFCIVCF